MKGSTTTSRENVQKWCFVIAILCSMGAIVALAQSTPCAGVLILAACISGAASAFLLYTAHASNTLLNTQGLSTTERLLIANDYAYKKAEPLDQRESIAFAQICKNWDQSNQKWWRNQTPRWPKRSVS